MRRHGKDKELSKRSMKSGNFQGCYDRRSVDQCSQPNQLSPPCNPLQVIMRGLHTIIFWIGRVLLHSTGSRTFGHTHFCLSLNSSILEQLYLREKVIMVEDVQKVGKELISKSMEVKELVTEVEEMGNQVRRWLGLMIKLSVMLFWAKMR